MDACGGCPLHVARSHGPILKPRTSLNSTLPNRRSKRTAPPTAGRSYIKHHPQQTRILHTLKAQGKETAHARGSTQRNPGKTLSIPAEAGTRRLRSRFRIVHDRKLTIRIIPSSTTIGRQKRAGITGPYQKTAEQAPKPSAERYAMCRQGRVNQRGAAPRKTVTLATSVSSEWQPIQPHPRGTDWSDPAFPPVNFSTPPPSTPRDRYSSCRTRDFLEIRDRAKYGSLPS